MIKKTIKYVDFNGVAREDDFYFNLTKADIIQMELGAKGNSLTEYMQEIVKSENGKDLLTVIDDFLSKSYGVKSADGRNFMKSPEIFANFRSSEAYSEFFMELLQNPDEMAVFFTKLMDVGSIKVDPDLSLSEQARIRSEAVLQGRKAPATADKAPSYVNQANLPTVVASPPADLTPEEIQAVLAARTDTNPLL